MSSQRQSLMADLGLLLLRVGIGAMFIHYGAPMMFGGPAKWAQVGASMQNFGLDFAPAFWGFMAAFVEFGGGICLVIGLFTRIFAALLLIVMIVAVRMHFAKGDAFSIASHAIDDGILFMGLSLLGPGRFSLDAMFRRS